MNALESIGLRPDQVRSFMACHAQIAPPATPAQIHQVLKPYTPRPKLKLGPRVYQTASCCGIGYRRWRYADRPFKITGQTCLHCELPLRWHTTNGEA